jgi:cell division protein FtsL
MLKLRSSLLILIFIGGILLAMGVIYLRSLTYKVGYEIAELKKREETLRKENHSLKSRYEKLGQNVKISLLKEKDASGAPVFVLPDSYQVLRPSEPRP